MKGTLQVSVSGVGFWCPRMPGWQVACEVLRGTSPMPVAEQARPSPVLLAPTERRRAPDTVAVALEVASRACEMAGVLPQDLPSVFSSTHGDLPINDYMCATLASTPKLLSPTKFHNSVHNAASGYWTIGTGSHQPSTALTAWGDSFAAGLLEAMVQCQADNTPVLLVIYDVAAKGPLATVTPSAGMLGGALVIRPGHVAGAVAQLSGAVQETTIAGGSNADLPEPWAPALAGIPIASAGALFAGLASAKSHRLVWPVGRTTSLVVEVNPLNGVA